jgi:curli biogenesis system outer membrane secretion channel CsgG
MKRLARMIMWVVLASFAGNFHFAATIQEPRKKRVAVLDFDYGTVNSDVTSMYGSNVDIGRGMAALLVKHLVTDGTYTIIEQKLVQTTLSQQDSTASQSADLATAAQIGKLLGVDAIIAGTITQFGGEHRKKSGGGAGAVPGPGVGGGAVKFENRKAIVSVEARFIDIDTGEVFAVADARGMSSRSAKSIAAFGLGSGGIGFGGADFTTSGFLETIIGEATQEAISRLSKSLIDAKVKLEGRRRAAEGLVAFVNASIVVVNIGLRAGLSVGDALTIERVAQEIRDPESGNLVRRFTEKVGEVRVTEVDDLSAVCSIVSGAQIRIGDLVKTPVR